VTVALAIALGILEALGPPPSPAMTTVKLAPRHLASLPSAAPAVAEVKAVGRFEAASPQLRPGRGIAGPIADPDPSMLEPYAGAPNLSLPRIGVGDRAPMSVYASGFDPSNVRPRVGMLIAGIGLSGSESSDAIKELPGGVTLAISPYARDMHLLDVARLTEHEYLISVPMEPQGYPVNDPDDRHALMASVPTAENLDRLRWVLSRLTGYVGITNAFGPMAGERLLGVSDQLVSVLQEVRDRGLLFVDARSGQPALPLAWNRSVDVVIDDDPTDAATLDQRLDALTQSALGKGSALGLVRVPRPVTLAHVVAWTNTLAAKGLALAPVSALVLPPARHGS